MKTQKAVLLVVSVLILSLSGCVGGLQKNVRKETVVECTTEDGKRKCREKEVTVIVEETPRADSYGYFYGYGGGYGHGYFGYPFGFCGTNHVGQPIRCGGPVAPSNYRWRW